MTNIGDLSNAGTDRQVQTFTLFVPEDSKDNKKENLFVRCVAFGKTAAFINQYTQKCSVALVSGKLEKRSYEKDGVKKESYQLVVREFQLVRSEKKEEQKQEEPTGNVAGEIVIIGEEEMFL